MTNDPFKEVSINGCKILNNDDCKWCGGKGTMERKGPCYMGGGVNQYTLWCKNCGAVAIHALNFSRRIEGYKITWDYGDDSKEKTGDEE